MEALAVRTHLQTTLSTHNELHWSHTSLSNATPNEEGKEGLMHEEWSFMAKEVCRETLKCAYFGDDRVLHTSDDMLWEGLLETWEEQLERSWGAGNLERALQHWLQLPP
ncbi:hypothetical protein N7447_007401 [Penicillium robsamsonii]|uniref:uncharacterized protein n=1 Tax=Penicillium robsamsonii TaxID=1792511 RepID=UPI002549B88B|nr:uncharacterized protein N7447_007401 [Penicillium robsamsonii]KAJ5825061.1 hypothetical protein N7447_007401 [Penicillium robsamsonii]